jgi:hypothetical protein
MEEMEAHSGPLSAERQAAGALAASEKVLYVSWAPHQSWHATG